MGEKARFYSLLRYYAFIRDLKLDCELITDLRHCNIMLNKTTASIIFAG